MTKTTETITLPSWIEQPFRMLEQAGEVWVVGGYVRDSLMGRAPGDLDLACSLPAQQTATLLQSAGYRVTPTGIAHGTITLMIDGHPVEITAFRTESSYSDHRHPDSVAPASSIHEDLARRDFRMNALAWHPQRGLIDPFGGLGDIAAGTIACVGDPASRFAEDALRILRALRFASQFGFRPDAATADALREAAPLLASISGERIAHEMTALLLGSHATQVLLDFGEVIAAAIPQLRPCLTCPQNTPYHCYDVWGHLAYSVEQVPAEPLTRWAAFLHDVGKPSTHTVDEGRSHFKGHSRAGESVARSILQDLHFPTRFVDDVCLLIRYHDDPVQCDRKHISRFVRKLGGSNDLFGALCDVKIADSLTHAPQYRQRAIQARLLKDFQQKMIAEGEPFTVKDLAINGTALISLGYKPGPALGAELNRLLESVLSGEVENTRPSLLAAAKPWEG